MRVGVCLERSPALLISLLGILKPGGAYVPLDPTYPAERRAFMLADSQAALLIRAMTDDAQTTKGDSRYGIRLIIEDLGRSSSEQRAAKVIHADTLAYVIYTSGSTG